ncbi:kinase-like domain-containing protein [Ampelomyces quisqualis]|uniref:Kinase-like domain-containing protein n=1 Tax=Ampelomyces quisqualis TaxID=50730 RepID=A0A6A5QD15_AMPQU|nr:kinase-like domain-containing protein [Ampelomyces quisqualis]
MAENNSPSACSACGWTSQKQRCCHYASTVKLFYGADARGVWYIGTDFVLKERPADPPTYEVTNTQFLHAHTSVPITEIAKHWLDKDGRQFIMVDRVEGEDLQTAWPTLSQDAKIRIAGQTASFLEQLRNLQSDKMASIGNAPLYSGWLFLQGAGTPHGPFASEDELWQSLVRKLEKLPEKVRDAFHKRLPPCAPYTFTHGDLTTVNIMVKDGNLVAIIDWERAGYFPVWWEYTAAGIGLGKEDAEWKELLQSKMQPFEDGKAFWKNFLQLSRYPDLDDGVKDFVEELLLR